MTRAPRNSQALILVPSLELQLLAFAIFTCYRAALYSFLGAFIASCFGPANVGKILGFSFLLGGLGTLLLAPAQYASNMLFDGSHVLLTALLMFCCVPAGAYVQWIVPRWDSMKRREAHQALPGIELSGGGGGAGT